MSIVRSHQHISWWYTDCPGHCALTCWMSLCDVDHQEVSHVAEVPDELLELVQLEDERGSGAAPEAQHQGSVACRGNTNTAGDVHYDRLWNAQVNPQNQTFDELAQAALLALHGDHRWVRSVPPDERLLAQGQPHVLARAFDEVEADESQTPVLVLELRVLGHGGLLAHAEEKPLGEARWDEVHHLEEGAEHHQVADHARGGDIDEELLEPHVCCSPPEEPLFTDLWALWKLPCSLTRRVPPTPSVFTAAAFKAAPHGSYFPAQAVICYSFIFLRWLLLCI